jgi:hypothetical protein
VLRRLAGPLNDTVPAERSIMVDDLLTFRLGFGSIIAAPRTYRIQVAENASTRSLPAGILSYTATVARRARLT